MTLSVTRRQSLMTVKPTANRFSRACSRKQSSISHELFEYVQRSQLEVNEYIVFSGPSLKKK